MSDDLVSRIDDLIVQATKERSHYYTASVLKEAKLALTEARAEIERRDSFIVELSDALRSIRPLGGSELFVKRCGNYYADPVYCKAAIEQDAEHKHNAMKAYVKERRRATAAESELSTLRARVREVVGQMVDLTEDFKVYGPAVVAARQLMEEVKDA